MKISVFPESCSIAGRPVMEAFIKSLKKDNQELIVDTIGGDIAVIWSILWGGRMKQNEYIWNTYRAKKKNVIVLEVGALDRNQTWKVGINGINRDAKWIEPYGETRHNLTLKPWKKDGEHIIVCGQHGLSEQWKGLPPMDEWMLSICRKITLHSNRRIILRPHPRFPVSPDYIKEFSNVLIAKPKRVEGTYDDFDFDETLENAWAVVNHSSGPAISAVISGVPVFVGRSSLAYDVGLGITDLDRIENPEYPTNREEWLNKISYTEWTTEEIASGVVWEKLKELL